MKKPPFSPLIGALVLVFMVLFLPQKWLTPFISDKKIEDAATSLNPTMFEGIYMQEKMLENQKYLPIYGSSELSRFDGFHPSDYFSANPQGYTPFLVGRGGTESIYHFLNFSTHTDELKNKKIVFILSPQWFTKGEKDEKHFTSNFSTLKAYRFALHPTVSDRLIVQGSKRMLDYDAVEHDPLLTTLLKANVNKDEKDTLKVKAATVLASGYLHLMERRDLLLSIVEPNKGHVNHNPSLSKGKDWHELEKNAEEMGKKHSNNNPYYIDNKYYNRMYKSKVHSLKGYKKHESYAVSPEYDEFQMILDVLKESGAEPLFISIPVNGYWYDYADFKHEGRTGYYKKIKRQIENEGYPVLDLSSYEYEKYFMKDSMHLGYKGWVQVDKGIQEFMK